MNQTLHAKPKALIPFKTITIIGLGLIGGSFAKAIRAAGLTKRIIGCDTDVKNLQQGSTLGVIDQAEPDIARAVRDAEFVFIAVPVGAMRAVFSAIQGQLAPGTLVTDTGSTKGSVIADFTAACPNYIDQFVPGHPIAGKETSGMSAAVADLYQNRTVILTPTDRNTQHTIQRIQNIWQACGANVIRMTPDQHDHNLAMTSHLPHMLAFVLMNLLGEQQTDLPACSAGGLRDTTRIAGSNPTMWRDIALANQTALQHSLHAYRQQLDQLITTLDTADGEGLFQLFSRAQQLRQALEKPG